MSSPHFESVVFALAPAGLMVVGGVVAAVWPPGPRLRSGIQHFAAGVVFAVVAAELLPGVKRQHAPLQTALSFGLGVALMLGLRRWAEHREAGGGSRRGLLAAVGLDVLLDGLLLGAGFAAGRRTGLLLTIALATELLSLGLATAATLGRAAGGRRTAVAATAGVAAVFVAGAAAGERALGSVSPAALAAVLSFGCAALLYLVTEELLVEAHEVPETSLAAAMFFVGFLALFVLDMVETPGP
jgi:ZIP family zinc transporter